MDVEHLIFNDQSTMKVISGRKFYSLFKTNITFHVQRGLGIMKMDVLGSYK